MFSRSNRELPLLKVEVSYREKTLIRIKRKLDGKNLGTHDGTYVLKRTYERLSELEKYSPKAYKKNEIFFIKMFPEKEKLKEGFAEALLGNIITKLIEQGFMDREKGDKFYSDCFSPAEIIILPDNVGAALIQPFVIGAKSLFQVLNENQEKKSAFWETVNRLAGRDYTRYIDAARKPRHASCRRIKMLFSSDPEQGIFFDETTINIQERNSTFTVYWKEAGKVASQSLMESDISDIRTMLPSPGQYSDNDKLINNIISKCSRTPHGLSYIIMMMVLFGNYSLHSGNIMVSLMPNQVNFTVIDYGAALRNFMGTLKKVNIWKSLEEEKFREDFWVFKKYLEYYKKIPGLFESVSDHAMAFLNMIGNSDEFRTLIVESVEETYQLYEKVIISMYGNDDWEREVKYTLFTYIYDEEPYRNLQERVKRSANNSLISSAAINAAREKLLADDIYEMVVTRLSQMASPIMRENLPGKRSSGRYSSVRLQALPQQQTQALSMSAFSERNIHELTRTTSSPGSATANMSQCTTKGNGDCAFHAALGQWNPSTQQFEIDDIAGKRRRVSDAIRASQSNPDLLPFIKSAIMTLVMDHNNLMKGEAYQRLKAAYQNYETSDNQLIAEKWAIFEPKLRQHSAIIQHIEAFIEGYIQEPQRDSSVIVRLRLNLRDRFFTCQNEGDDTLRALIMSIPELEKAYLDYKKLAQGINFDGLLNDPALFNEYAVFISTPGRWLLPCELAIIAHVFDISVEYYAMHTAAPDLFNPGRPAPVAVCFNGRDHYERMADENDLPALHTLRPVSSFNLTALSSSTRVLDGGGDSVFARHDSTTDDATFPVEIEKSKVVQVNLGTLPTMPKLQKFNTAIENFYLPTSTHETKQAALKTLKEIALEFCDASNGLNVRAREAKKALEALKSKATWAMGEVYPHIYTILQATLCATTQGNKNYLKKMGCYEKASDATSAAKAMLQQLNNWGSSQLSISGCGTITEELKKAHDHALKKWLPASTTEIWDAITHFTWAKHYQEGTSEKAHGEHRRHDEAFAIYLLKQIIASLKYTYSWSIEERWLLVTALTDYDEGQKTSPFYNAIRQLAIEENKTPAELRDELNTPVIIEMIASWLIDSKVSHALSIPDLQQKLQRRLERWLVKEINAKDSKSKGLSGAVSSVIGAPLSTARMLNDYSIGVSTSASTPIASAKCWESLFDKYFDEVSGNVKKVELNEENIKNIFNFFDAKYHIAEEVKKEKYEQLLEAAFCKMDEILNAEKLKISFFSSPSRSHLTRFYTCIAPKQGLPAYTFAKFCEFLLTHNATSYVLSPHEDAFVREYFSRLYDASSEGFKPEGSIDSCRESAIMILYKPKIKATRGLHVELLALERKQASGELEQKDIAPYKAIFQFGISRLWHPVITTETDSNGKTFMQRLQCLDQAAKPSEQATVRFSSMKRGY